MRAPQKAGEVKITRKLSIKDFVRILEKRPLRVIVPASILRQSKNIKLIVDTMSSVSKAGAVPEIVIVSRDKPPMVIGQDWVDPHIRSLVGTRPSFDERFLMELLDANATSRKNGMLLSELTPGELKLLYELKEREWVEISRELKVYLTELGATIASGAKKLYPRA